MPAKDVTVRADFEELDPEFVALLEELNKTGTPSNNLLTNLQITAAQFNTIAAGSAGWMGLDNQFTVRWTGQNEAAYIAKKSELNSLYSESLGDDIESYGRVRSYKLLYLPNGGSIRVEISFWKTSGEMVRFDQAPIPVPQGFMYVEFSYSAPWDG
jgi:hypothetical protein